MIKQPSEQLRKLVERINLLPPESQTGELQVWSGGTRLKIRSEDATYWPEYDRFRSKYINPTHKWTQAARRSLYESLMELPDKFKDFIWGDVAPIVDLSVKVYEPNIDIDKLWIGTKCAVERYEDFRQLRVHIHNLARFITHLPSWQQQFDDSRRKRPTKLQSFANSKTHYPHPDLESYPIPFVGSIRFELDNRGIVHFKLDEFSEALMSKDAKGRMIDIRLIRECKLCRSIFWAKRVDNFVCSLKCRQLLKARIRSEEIKADPGTYKENRINNEGLRKKRKGVS